MRESFSAPAMGRPPQAGQARRSCLIVFPLVGGILLLLVAVALILFLGLRQVLFGDEVNTGIPIEVVKLTPPVVPTASVSPLPTPPQSCETIISSDDVEVAVSLPNSLTVSGKPFPVVAIVADEGGGGPPNRLSRGGRLGVWYSRQLCRRAGADA